MQHSVPFVVSGFGCRWRSAVQLGDLLLVALHPSFKFFLPGFIDFVHGPGADFLQVGVELAGHAFHFIGHGLGEIPGFAHVLGDVEKFHFAGVEVAHEFVVAVAVGGDRDGVVGGEVEDEAGVPAGKFPGVALFEDRAEADAVKVAREGGGASERSWRVGR